MATEIITETIPCDHCRESTILWDGLHKVWVFKNVPQNFRIKWERQVDGTYMIVSCPRCPLI